MSTLDRQCFCRELLRVEMRVLLIVLMAASAARGQFQASGASTSTSQGAAGPLAQGGPPAYNCARTDTNVRVLPLVPPRAGANTCTAGNLQNCGNLTGAGTVMSESSYNNVQVARCTDANTP